MTKKLTRRQFLRLGPLGVLESLSDSGDDGETTNHPSSVRPPGAIPDEAEFTEKCDGCGRCSDACPYDAISVHGPAAGKDENTPFLDVNETPCHWCPSMDCIEACPTGALVFNEGELVDPLGVAEVDLELCLTSQGILCDDCMAACPSSINAVKMIDRTPHINSELCVGCGLCVYYCPAVPNAIKVG